MRNLMPLAWLVAAILVIDAAWNPMVLIVTALFPRSAASATTFDVAGSAMMLVTAIAFAIWTYHAGRNLLAAGYTDLEFSPASRVWWFLVPIMSLWKPLHGMREMWNASHGEPAYDLSAGLVTLWWAFYLGGNLVGAVLAAMAAADPSGSWLLWIVSALDAATSVTAILMVLRITRAQRQLGGAALTEVFA